MSINTLYVFPPTESTRILILSDGARGVVPLNQLMSGLGDASRAHWNTSLFPLSSCFREGFCVNRGAVSSPAPILYYLKGEKKKFWNICLEDTRSNSASLRQLSLTHLRQADSSIPANWNSIVVNPDLPSGLFHSYNSMNPFPNLRVSGVRFSFCFQ